MPRVGWSRPRAELVAVALAGSVLLSACGGSDPSPASEGVSLACVGVAEQECQSVASAAAGRVGGAGTIVAVAVEAYPCDIGQCPPGFEERQELSIVVELVGPPRIHQFGATTMFTGSLTIDAGLDAVSFPISPASRRTGSGLDAFSTGHCGLGSPIDADGSLWDPVGFIDPRAKAVIGESSGRFLLTGDDTARFEARDGFVIGLVRRAGAKSYLGCD